MKSERSQSAWAACALFLIVLMVYFLTSTGRIDIIDTQIRLEGTRGVLATGLPLLNDPALQAFGKPTRLGDSVKASGYGVSPHLIYAPFLLAIQSFDGTVDFEQFWFSHINHLFAAGTIVVLFYFYLAIGFGMATAVRWSLVCAFFTQFFVTATSTFYQPFQGFFLFAAMFFAYKAGRSHSFIHAIASGVLFAVVINIKPSYIILAPAIALLFASWQEARVEIKKQNLMQILLFAIICILGVCFWEFYRSLYIFQGRQSGVELAQTTSSVTSTVMGGSVVKGLLTILVSPGKGAVFFSPILFVGIWGVKELFTSDRLLAIAAAAIAMIWLLGVAQTSFPGGDWCWGPRYLVPAIPVIFLFVPYGYQRLFAARPARGRWLLAYCLTVQLLGLSLDFHQYFFRNGLDAFFWHDQSFYLTHSQLIERPIDIMESVKHVNNLDLSGPYRPGPYPELLTYAVFGAYHPDRTIMIEWMKQYPVFWLPGPWPLWMSYLAPERLPINMGSTVLAAVALLLAGLLLLYLVLIRAAPGNREWPEASHEVT